MERQAGTPRARWPRAGSEASRRRWPPGGAATWPSRVRSACAHPAAWHDVTAQIALLCGEAASRAGSGHHETMGERARFRHHLQAQWPLSTGPQPALFLT
jgi:hypothetical protein